jgi:hypothetical protein
VTRYETQLTKVRAILEAFDRPDTDFAAVVGLLQEMQAGAYTRSHFSST